MIDLRSDTVTKPTEAMRQAMASAEVGDDVYQEDPSVRALEERAAELTGKEAALFVTSGTQGNQVAVASHCVPGQEIILEADAHLFLYEGGAASAFAGVQTYAIKGTNGMFSAEQVRRAIRPEDDHDPETGLICLENTHNRAGGAVISPEQMKDVYDVAKAYNVPVHLDGARLFHAAVALGQPLSSFTQYTDTVQLCLSKGLGAPVGSILAGDASFIKRARKWRKRLGGGWRQAGVLAAPALLALNTMVERLAEDHEHAKILADGIHGLHGLTVIHKVETNIILVDVEKTGHTSDTFVEALKERGVRAVAFDPYIVRFVTHKDVSKDDVMQTLAVLSSLVS